MSAAPRWLWLVVAALVAAAGVAEGVSAWAHGVHAWLLLAWAGAAGAAVFAAALAVPAIIDRVRRRAAEREHAAAVEAELWTVMRPLPEPARPEHGTGRPESRAGLLRADAQVVGFTGRDDEMRNLRSWVRGPARDAVRLVTGPGGTGKTRLAVHFATCLQAAGWRCGFLRAGRGAAAVGAISAAGNQPTLLLVDYAEASADLETLLQDVAQHAGEPEIRVLLLARALGEWWREDGPLRRHGAIRDLLAGAQVIELDPLTRIPRRHHEVFDAAVEAFALHCGIEVPAVALRPVPEGTPVLVLLLHAAALTAVLAAVEGNGAPAEVAATEQVVNELVGHENNYWTDSAVARGLDQLWAAHGTRRQAVACAGLLGASDKADACSVVSRLPVLAGAPPPVVEQIVAWLHELYPPDGSWLGPIQPDLLLEYLVTTVLAADAELAGAALTGLPEPRARHALNVLARALDHYPAPAAALLRQLLWEQAGLLAFPAVRLARNLRSAALGQALAGILADAPLTPGVLAELADNLNQPTFQVAEPAIIVYQRTGTSQLAAGQFTAAATTAGTLESIASHLRTQGLRGAVADAYRAAVTLYRALEDAQPGHHHAALAHTLTSLADAQNRAGRAQEAHPAALEALGLYRVLEKARHGRYRAGLARALATLGDALRALGRAHEAHPVALEAVTRYRVLEKAGRGRHRAGLARALTSLSGILCVLDRAQEAHPIAAEAVKLCRAAEKDEPGRHSSGLAAALAGLGGTLFRLGRHEDALRTYTEAAEVYRVVEKAEPGCHRADLADALDDLGISLRGLALYRDARPVWAEVVKLYRELEDMEPGAYRADLARALTGLGITLARLDKVRGALALELEAVALYRALEEAEPGRHRSGLAIALYDLGIILKALGQIQNAHRAMAEAVQLQRELADADSGSNRLAFARALDLLGAMLRDLDRPEDACTAYTEAAALYRALEYDQPGPFREWLASVLASLGDILRNLGRLEEARAVTDEATALCAALNSALELGSRGDAVATGHEGRLRGGPR